jgi:hypothetical protein
MAGDLLTKDLITYDPLSETTRRERTALLGLSMLGIALVKVPLVPEKLAFLGIEFAKVQQGTFVKLYALVIVYYLFAFCIYAFTDYVAWRRHEVITLAEYDEQRKERQSAAKADLDALLGTPETTTQRKRASHGNPAYVGFASYWLAFGAARARAAFEFLVPILFASYVLVVLLSHK